MAPGEGREQTPDGEQSWSSPFGHVEVDAALQGPGERRVRSQPLPETEGTSGVRHVDFDPFGRLLEPDHEMTQQPGRRGT
jgi:hypothetical protein